MNNHHQQQQQQLPQDDDIVYSIHSDDDEERSIDIDDEDDVDEDDSCNLVLASDDCDDEDDDVDDDEDNHDGGGAAHMDMNRNMDMHHDSVMEDVNGHAGHTGHGNGHGNGDPTNGGGNNMDAVNQQQHQQLHHQQQLQQQQHHMNIQQQQQQQQQQVQRQGGAQLNNNNNNNNNNDGSSNNNNNNNNSADIDNEPPLDGYERTNRIGQGAYGIVYKGIQRSTGSTVAIKRIPFGDATPEGGVPCNVIREISLLRELDHPNVVRLLDVNQAQPGELYLVFEFVAHDLKTFLDRNQSTSDVSRRHGLEVGVVRSFLRQILEGVGFCHTYRILHRDLKPHNLLISSDGRQLKLADFGLARLSGLPSGPYTAEVVTLWYRAPELLLGANRYCGPVDVWSIGCIFAEMATGYALFPGRSDIDQLFKIFQRRGTPNNDIWPHCTRLPYYQQEFPKWRPRPIQEFMDSFDKVSVHAADLLEQLLQYDPEKRLVCKAALSHPFFFES